MKRIIYISFIIIVVVISMYFYNFNTGKGLSKSTEVWGQFGDYLGGVVNPILTFLSIVLLIKSIDLQRDANASIINENKRQEKLDYLKNFEMRFYSLIDAQRTAFEKFTLLNVDGVNIKGVEAVNKLEDFIFNMKNEGKSKEVVSKFITDCDVSESIYSSVRRFYLLVRLIDEKLECEERDEYYEILINMTDFPLVRLIVLALCVYDWDIIKYIDSSSVLAKDELVQYRAYFQL